MKYVISLFLYSTLAWSNQLTGHFKTYPTYKDNSSTSDELLLQNYFKLQSTNEIYNNIKFEGAYELTLSYEKPAHHYHAIRSYRFLDLEKYLHEESVSNDHKWNIEQNLNKLNLSLVTSAGDFLIGRTLISFGTSKSISPNDILTSQSIALIDKEDRNGVDVINFKKAINDNFLIDSGIVLGEDGESQNNAFFIRPKILKDKLDLTLNLLRFKEKNLLGVELQHPINDAGFIFDYAFVDQSNSRLFDYSRLTTGIDYKFQNTLYLSLEYHYNQATLSNSYYPEEFIYLKNKHYIILTSNYEITPLLTLSFQNFHALKDGSNYFSLKADYNLTDNSYLGIGTQMGTGNLRDEFNPLLKTYYTSLRYYF